MANPQNPAAPLMALSDRTLAELGVMFGLISIAGVGVPMIWPDEKVIGAIFVLFGAGGFVIVAILMAIRIFRERGAKLGMSLAVVGTFLIIFGGIIGMLGAFKVDSAPSRNDSLTETPSLLSRFMNLLQPKQGGTIYGFTEINVPEMQTRIYYNLFLDFNAQTKYVSFYVPPQRDILRTLSELDCVETVEQVGGAVQFSSHVLGGTTTVNTKDYLFSGAAYIFHEDYISLEQIVALTKAFKAKKCSVQFYSTEFKVIEWGAIKNGALPKFPSFEIKDGLIQKTTG